MQKPSLPHGDFPCLPRGKLGRWNENAILVSDFFDIYIIDNQYFTPPH
jgi:hypothetical protein